MSVITKAVAVTCVFASLISCAAMEDYKYMMTGKEAAPPPRTVDAAQAQFNDNLVVGQSTEADLKAALGSPAEIKREGGDKVYVYLKNVSTKGVSVDVGTTYTASYWFGPNGKLKDKQFAARPMGNPLTN